MQEPTPVGSIVLFVVAALLGAVGSYLYKAGAEGAAGSVASFVQSPRILAGVACYITVMVLFVAAYRNGGALTVLYPTYASTFVFAALIGLLCYGTPIRLVNVAGMILLITGMYLMGRS